MKFLFFAVVFLNFTLCNAAGQLPVKFMTPDQVSDSSEIKCSCQLMKVVNHDKQTEMVAIFAEQRSPDKIFFKAAKALLKKERMHLINSYAYKVLKSTNIRVNKSCNLLLEKIGSKETVRVYSQIDLDMMNAFVRR